MTDSTAEDRSQVHKVFVQTQAKVLDNRDLTSEIRDLKMRVDWIEKFLEI